MSRVLERLKQAGIILPPPATSLGLYAPAVRAGNLVFTSGQLPMHEGRLMANGLVGQDVSAEQARDCAGQCARNALSAVASVCDLDRVLRVVKVVCYVASAPGFTAQPAVADGASALMVSALGEMGRHAREAVGVSSLPLGAPVEVSLVVEVA